VTSSFSDVSTRDSRLRRSLRDSRGSSRASDVGGRSATAADNDVIGPTTRALSAWSAAALRDRRHTAISDMAAARQRVAPGAGVAATGKESSRTAGGGLSLSSTASNDTGYSSIGNSGERVGPCRPAKSGGAGDVDVTSACRPSSACRDDIDRRPSVAELRQRFQTHSVSQPAELSKRCAADTFSSTGIQ